MTNLTNADLTGADLTGAILIDTKVTGANLSGCKVHGISAWGITGTPANQQDLVITKPDEPSITVDNLEVAQFIYLLLHNDKIREVFDTISSKVVLILGNFSPERKPILDGLRSSLRDLGFSPVLFDFEKPASRGRTETVSTLAHMVRLVIADITDARSIPQELMAIVPNLPSVAV